MICRSWTSPNIKYKDFENSRGRGVLNEMNDAKVVQHEYGTITGRVVTRTRLQVNQTKRMIVDLIFYIANVYQGQWKEMIYTVPREGCNEEIQIWKAIPNPVPTKVKTLIRSAYKDGKSSSHKVKQSCKESVQNKNCLPNCVLKTWNETNIISMQKIISSEEETHKGVEKQEKMQIDRNMQQIIKLFFTENFQPKI